MSRGKEGWKGAGQGLGKAAPEATTAVEALQGGLSGRGVLEPAHWRGGASVWRRAGGPWAWPGLSKADPEPHTRPFAGVRRPRVVGRPADHKAS